MCVCVCVCVCVRACVRACVCVYNDLQPDGGNPTHWLVVVCTLQAEELYNARAYEAGDEAARKARLWAWLAVVVGTIVLLLVLGGLTAWLVVRFGVNAV